MKLKCKEDPVHEGKKIMNFTKGKVYDFKRVDDPEGWETKDDTGRKENFFTLNIMFEPL